MTPGTALPARFWAKVEAAGEHWLWIGAHQTHGYGSFSIGGKTYLAHRLAFEDAHGPIPAGLVIDHLCRVHACVNPGHMELVTTAENHRRGKALITHCPQGHEYTPENTRVRGNRRDCKTCNRAHRAASRQRAAQKTVTGVSS